MKYSIESEINYLKKRLIIIDDRTRVPKEVAKQMLLNNESSIVRGTVRHFEIMDIGLGICEIALAPCSSKSTELVKEFTI